MELAERNAVREAKLDATLFSAIIALACIGAAAVFSSTFQQGLDMKSPDPMYFILRHLAYLCAAIAAMYLAMKFGEEEMNNYSIPLLLAGIGFLILVFIPPFGIERFGARRWVNLFIFSFQPAEVVKLFFVIYISRFISDRKELVKDFWRGLTPVLMVYSFISILLLLQPDAGSTILIGVLMGVMFFIGGTRMGYFGV
ncbi:MAG: FtsW/RodA/SpoVE family cell cycle protein, partial [Deltaproteobacteria bacterium]|nr:FtsW/RodA/SpoVE family cell cycle protein [Deltaproteobacteria bacterium]